MAFTITRPVGMSSAQFAHQPILPAAGPQGPAGHPGNYKRTLFYHDIFVDSIFLNVLWRHAAPVQSRPATSAGVVQDISQEVEAFKPINLAYKRVKDLKTYSRPLSAVRQHAKDGVLLSRLSSSYPMGERQVLHGRAIGLIGLLDEPSLIHQISATGTQSGILFRTFGTTNVLRSRIRYSGGVFSALLDNHIPSWKVFSFIDEALIDIKAHFDLGNSLYVRVKHTALGWIDWLCTSFDYTIGPDGYPDHIWYTVEQKVGDNGCTIAEWHKGVQHLRFSIDPKPIEGIASPVGDRAITISSGFTIRSEIVYEFSKSRDYLCREVGITPSGGFSTKVVPTRVGCISNPTQDDLSSDSPVQAFLDEPRPHHYSLQNRVYSHALDVQKDLHLFIPTASISTASALEKFIDVVKAEHIETMLELSSLARLIPPSVALAEVYAAIKRGKFWDAQKALLNAIADVKLAFEFGIKPLVGNIDEMGQKAESIASRLSNLSLGHQTLYGDFFFEFPEPLYGYKRTVLQTRSKIRVGFDSSAFLMTMLGLNAVGLMPQLSQLWQIQSYSFVIDWFTNASKRLAVVDSNQFLFCLRFFYATHSYRIISYLDDTDVNPFGLSVPDWVEDKAFRTAPRIEAYIRHFSLFIPNPSVFTSRYDFFPPGGIPDFGTAGSLLWKAFQG